MANNTTCQTRISTADKDQVLISTSESISWLAVFIAVCLAILILNIVTIIVFVKQRQLRRRSTYLIIHLATVDLLTGAVTGPLLGLSRLC